MGYQLGQTKKKAKELKQAKLSFESDPDHGGDHRGITLDKVEEIFERYCIDMPVARIARECNVAPQTVYRYIKDGDERRGIVPLVERRKAVYKQALEARDGQLAMVMSRMMTSALETAEAAGQRLTKRIGAAEELEDPVLYVDGNQAKQMATFQKAYNPDSKAFARIAGVASKIAEIGGKALGGDQKPSVNINTNANAASQAVSLGEIDVALGHLNDVREASKEDGRVIVNGVLERMSLERERESEEEISNGDSEAG